MSRALFIASLFASLSSAACAAPAQQRQIVDPAVEYVDRDAIVARIRAAIDREDFAGLSAMADEFRSSRVRTPDGTWKLAILHFNLQEILDDGLSADAGCQYRRADFVKRWAAATPKNPAPSITDAALISERAWCIRGSGYADTIPAEIWPKFHADIAAAMDVLDKHRAAASRDPEYYVVMLNAMRSAGASKSEFRRVLDEATGREPGYHRIYLNAVWSSTPQWGGSPAEVEEFARYAAERSAAEEQTGMYARIFWSLDACGCRTVERTSSWPILKQSMRDVFARFPTQSSARYFSDLSCRMGDIEEGRGYIRAMHPQVKDEASFVALFATCDARARQPKDQTTQF